MWHLSKDWQPEWGGALYWAQEPHNIAFKAASFNTLVLFSVNTKSSHFVTSVSPHATQKRLSFNGWFQSDWIPKSSDNFEEILATEEKRSKVTHLQLQYMTDMLGDKFQRFAPGKREILADLKTQIMQEFFPQN